jgi:hypothetical protein
MASIKLKWRNLPLFPFFSASSMSMHYQCGKAKTIVNLIRILIVAVQRAGRVPKLFPTGSERAARIAPRTQPWQVPKNLERFIVLEPVLSNRWRYFDNRERSWLLISDKSNEWISTTGWTRYLNFLSYISTKNALEAIDFAQTQCWTLRPKDPW